MICKILCLFVLSMSVRANPYQGDFKKLFGENATDSRNYKEEIKIKYKAGQCLMFAKAKETFWKPTESNFFKIESIGDSSYKVREIFFLNQSKYYFDENPKALLIKAQDNFYAYDCPLVEDELSGEELKEVLKKIKNSN